MLRQACSREEFNLLWGGRDSCVGGGARTPRGKSLQKCQQRTCALVPLIRGQDSREMSLFAIWLPSLLYLIAVAMPGKAGFPTG